MMRLLLAALLLAASAGAQDIETLLQALKKEQTARSAELREREARFAAEKAQQESQLKAAEAALAALKKETQRLQKTFDEQEAKIEGLGTRLHARSGDLGEIFGVVRQSAGELKGIVENSVVSAEIPGRGAFLSTMAASKRLPSSQELRRLWLMLFEEIVASGRVATFPAGVVLPDGSEKETKVTRVGLFSVTADGEYLRFDPDEQKLITLPRQPEGNYRTIAAAVEEAAHGSVVPAAIDPTRGAIFDLLTEKPTAAERIEQGGAIGYVIIVIAGAGLLLGLFRLGWLLRERTRVRRQLSSPETPDPGNVLGRVLGVYDANRSEGIEVLENRLDEAILGELPRLTGGEPLIKILAAAAPLLGLLGTVVGMIETFQAISLFGTGDPKLMAGGISQALVTTMLGLLAAVPLLFMHALLRSQSKALIELLSQQTAGLIARRMEGA